MDKIQELRKLFNEFCKYDINIYELCYYIGITNIDKEISNLDLEILLKKCEEFSGEYTDPIEVGQALANEIYINKNIKMDDLKNMNSDQFYAWYNDGRELGIDLKMDDYEVER